MGILVSLLDLFRTFLALPQFTIIPGTKIISPTLPVFQGIKGSVKFISAYPHNPIFYPSHCHYGYNVISITCSGNYVEYYATHHLFQFHQYVNHARIINRNQYLSVIIHTQVQIQPSFDSNCTDGEIRCMYKTINKTKFVWHKMESLYFSHCVTNFILGR